MKSHTHPCSRCGVPVSCTGRVAENHDGFPAVICDDYHRWNGDVEDVRCDKHSNYDGEWDVPSDGESAAERDERLLRG